MVQGLIRFRLLSKRPELLRDVDSVLGRFQTTDNANSLSAIFLDDEYYHLLETGTEMIDGLPVLGLLYLPVFKIHAWTNLSLDRDKGLPVHSDDINKHRSDVCKLCSLNLPKTKVILPPQIRDEIARFVEAQPWDDSMLRGWNLNLDSDGMAKIIRSTYLNDQQ